MLKKIVPVLVLAAFVAGPVAAPAFAAGNEVPKKCQKLKGDAQKKCIAEAKKAKK